MAPVQYISRWPVIVLNYAGLLRLDKVDAALKLRPLMRDRFIAAIPARHALAGRKRIPLGELAGEPLIIFSRQISPRPHDAIIAATNMDEPSSLLEKMMPRYLAWMCLLAPATIASQLAFAQNYPTRPIHIVTAQPGGNTDVVTRMIAKALNLGQPVVTENRPSGVLAADTVKNAPPDGHTLLLQSASFWVGPLIQKLPYDPVKDFEPITLTHNAPFFLYVHPSLPARSVKELIALAKAKPGELNYGSSAVGSSNHLAMELFKYMAGVNIQRVPYKGAGPAGVGLVANQVQVMFGSAPFGLSHVKAGRLRVLGVADDKPSALAPDVPTISSAGLPGYESGGMAGIFAPARTPKALIGRINTEIVRALNQPEIKGKFPGMGLELVGSSPEQAAAYIQADIAKWSKLIKSAGIAGQ